MIQITEDYVKATAFNESAFSNAKKLASSGKIIKTHKTKEDDLIFGECMGSGKSNYVISVDFIDANEPVFRCSCPSRQIPCKHSSALLYAYYLNPEVFDIGDIPEDVVSKRQKLEKRAEKKKEEGDKPKKVNVTAFVKKMKLQLEGIALIEQFIKECMGAGLASISIGQITSYQKELVKELGNYYIPSLQGKVQVILELMRNASECKTEHREDYLKEVLRQLSKLYALLKKCKEALNNHIDAQKIIDADSADIFTKMGYIWKIDELKSLGFTKEKRQLVQLGFYQYDNVAEKALVDVGYFVDLDEADVYKSLNIVPYKLLKRLKNEDSLFEALDVEEYVVYPGEMNKRIRWEGCSTQPVTKEMIGKIKEKAQTDFKLVLKTVKNQLKNPLADEHPAVLLHYKALSMYENEEGKITYGIKDAQGETILLDNVMHINMPNTVSYIPYVLEKEDLMDQVLLGVFEYQSESNHLVLQPISVITASEIKRLLG